MIAAVLYSFVNFTDPFVNFTDTHVHIFTHTASAAVGTTVWSCFELTV